jgi:hypothetical protein
MLRFLRLALVAAIAPVLLIAAAPLASGRALAQGCGTWTQMGAYAAPGFSLLSGLAVVAPGNLWTIGSGGFEHSTGAGFALVASPSLNGQRGGPQAIAGDAPNDVWTVGEHHAPRAYAPTATLIEHFDGSGWRIVSSPSPDATSNVLQGVVALGRDDVWAVGRSAGRALVEHFDGASWTVASAPAPGSTSYLKAVAAAGRSSVKAVGSFMDGSGWHPLVLSFDGGTWSRDASVPAGADVPPWLTTVVNVPNTTHFVAAGTSTQSSLFVFDGSGWSSRPGAGVRFPGSPPQAGDISGIDALSDTNVWVVGSYTGDQNAGYASQPFALRFNGSGWSDSGFSTFSMDHMANVLTTVGHQGGAVFVLGYDNPTTTSYGQAFAATLAC